MSAKKKPPTAANFGSIDVEMKQPENAHQFIESRKKELEEMRKRKVFAVDKRSDVPKSQHICGTRWIDLVKTIDGERK